VPPPRPAPAGLFAQLVATRLLGQRTSTREAAALILAVAGATLLLRFT
jgi:hypothetical protein